MTPPDDRKSRSVPADAGDPADAPGAAADARSPVPSASPTDPRGGHSPNSSRSAGPSSSHDNDGAADQERAAIGWHHDSSATIVPLIEAVRASDRELQQEEEIEAFASERSAEDRISVGRDQLIESILFACQADVAELGIELIDVRIRRIDYSAKVRQSVQKRMIAERNQIAERYRSEGTGRAAEIEGEKRKELKRIESESFRKAETIRGEADAEATRIYAESFGADPEFYAFYQTLDTYRQALVSGDTTLVLSTESELLKYLKGEQGRAGESKGEQGRGR